MDDTKKEQRFKQALSVLLESLPENHKINTALFLTNNELTTFINLTKFWAGQCEVSVTYVNGLLSSKQEHVRTVKRFLKHEREIVQRTAECELQSWISSLNNKKG